MIGVLDYGLGNLYSIQSALRFLAVPHALVTEAGDADHDFKALIIPGVAAFGEAVNALTSRGLDGVVAGHLDLDRPLLGICLGAQLLFDASEESPGYRGLGIIPGTVRLLPAGRWRRPNQGWMNTLGVDTDSAVPPLPWAGCYYFSHSFYMDPDDSSVVSAVSGASQATAFPVAVSAGDVIGVQFHPERSGHEGLAFLRAFADWVELRMTRPHDREKM